MPNIDKFPTGQKRKKEVSSKIELADEFEVTGLEKIIKNGHYTWVDSPLEETRSYIEGRSFSDSFSYVLPEKNIGLKQYIEKSLEARKGKAIGVEFGGIGSQLFSGFSPNFFAKSMGVTLVDQRTHNNDEKSFQEDIRINHEILINNILKSETYEYLKKWLNHEKIDLIISRMAAGLEFIPLEPYTTSKILEIWYELLNDGGIMFVQVPVEFNKLLVLWVEMIQKKFSEVIEIQFIQNRNNNSAPGSCVRLRKLPGAPRKLPLLDPRTVNKIPLVEY